MSGREIGRAVARLVGSLLLVAALAGCAVDATVTVAVRDDGSGTVSLAVVADPAAVRVAEAGGGSLEQRIRLADLTAAGWSVAPWDRRPDGSAAIVLTKPFASLEQVPTVLAEISGPSGPLREETFRRTSSFLGYTDQVAVAVDLGGATTGISQDPALVDRIRAEGVDVGSLDAQLLAALRSSTTVTLVVELSGGERRSVTVAPGSSGRLDLEATRPNRPRIALLSVAAVLVLVAGALGVGRGRRRRSRGRRTGRGRGPASTTRPVVSAGARGAPPPRPTSRRTPPGS